MKKLTTGLAVALLFFGAIWAYASDWEALATAMLFAATFAFMQVFDVLEAHASYTNKTFVLMVRFGR